jgi:hypothetical protein
MWAMFADVSLMTRWSAVAMGSMARLMAQFLKMFYLF